MTLFGRLLGRDPAKLRADADAAFEAQDWGTAKLDYQRLLERLAEAPEEERAAVRRRIDDCQSALVRRQLAEVDRQRREGDIEAAVELCRATIEMADGLAIKTEVKRKADALTEELTRASQPDEGATSDEDVFLALSGSWSEEQADELLGYGDEFKKAFLALHEGKVDEARDAIRGIVEGHPDGLHIRIELARALLASHRRSTPAAPPSEEEAKAEARAALEEAAGLYRAYLEQEPEDASDELYATVQSELAQVMVEMGDVQAAEESLVEAADATQEQPFGHLNLGRFYRVQHRYDEAIARLEIAVDKMGTVTPDIRVYRELGFAHRDAGHPDEAVSCLQAVIDHQASLGVFDFDPETAEALAELLLRKGDPRAASDLYRHLARGHNVAGRFRYHLLAGKLLKEAGRKADGVRELHAARALAADDAARAEVDALLGGAGEGRQP